MPLSKRPELFRAVTIERMRIPYRKPLYWKWMWSIINNPGERRTEMAAVWACVFDAAEED
jgi:hypothetical protein